MIDGVEGLMLDDDVDDTVSGCVNYKELWRTITQHDGTGTKQF